MVVGQVVVGPLVVCTMVVGPLVVGPMVVGPLVGWRRYHGRQHRVVARTLSAGLGGESLLAAQPRYS